MAINTPVLSSGPTISRSRSKTIVGAISTVVPPDPVFRVVDGNAALVKQEPVREGQMLFVIASEGRTARMYIVVQVEGVLEWRIVSFSGRIRDPRTGQPKDPLRDIYWS